MLLILLFLAACFLAYTNGANDNFKGVATLFGSNTTSYKKAINWATVTTFSGSVAAMFLASQLIKNFSGKGLVPDALLQMPIFAISIALGAAITVFLATKAGMPVSTTHGLVGALFGVGVMAVGTNFNFLRLGEVFLLPLILSPILAGGFSLLAYSILKNIKKKSQVEKSNCICVNETAPKILANGNSFNFTNSGLELSSCTKSGCSTDYKEELFGITVQKVLDFFHFLSAGAVSFARGLNDTPKIVGLLLVIKALDIKLGMLSVGVAIAIGGLLNAKKVGVTMSKKITPMTHGQGFTANIITAFLVTTASINGLPVSTTHVSVGSIFGIGSVTRKADLKVINKIILSWVLTLPIAATFGAMAFLILKNL